MEKNRGTENCYLGDERRGDERPEE